MGATMGKSGGNFLDSLPSTQGTLHVVMLGLDSAGKTTALYRMKFDQYLNTVPTIGFNCEKVRGSVGKAKGVQFLVWDVGGQEKLRPLWRSYTRCTDGIIFVIDSVDVERMEEAKMELMRTAKCSDNQGVPVLILANKQDLPGAREPKELEKLLGLHELSMLYPASISLNSPSSHSSNTGQSNQSITTTETAAVTNSPPSSQSCCPTTTPASPTTANQSTTICKNNLISSTGSTGSGSTIGGEGESGGSSSSKTSSSNLSSSNINTQSFKGWYIQPACAITGEGLQEGLEALYDMIMKKRKLNKTHKKKR